MSYVPEKGDIVWLNFDPSAGMEITKLHPAFVLSRKPFNEHTAMAIVAPITSTVRGIKLEVRLPEECKTQGTVLVHQLRSLDFAERQARFIEKAPNAITEKVTQLAKVIIS